MDQQPDKLFRDKLEGYQKPAPSDSWKRISGKLHKRSNRKMWLKVAAAIFLLAVAGILLFPIQHKPAQNTIAEKVTPPEKAASSQSNQKAPPETSAQPLPEEKQTRQPVTPPAENKNRRTEKKKTNAPVEQQQAQNESRLPASEEKVPVEVSEVLAPEEIVALNKPVQAKQSETDGSITLIYSADEVNKKYLNKNAIAEATSEEKRSSTLKKLLDKAYDLKHNQDPLGELRQKKNEILALNFKTDKQRSQNK